MITISSENYADSAQRTTEFVIDDQQRDTIGPHFFDVQPKGARTRERAVSSVEADKTLVLPSALRRDANHGRRVRPTRKCQPRGCFDKHLPERGPQGENSIIGR